MEYAILLGVVTVAFVGMQTYAKRGLQATIKLMADQLGNQREGTEDIDLSFDWKTKGDAQITTTTHASGNVSAPATRSVQYLPGGGRVFHTDEITTSTGILSETLGGERNQQ